jgi:hypothetical protein
LARFRSRCGYFHRGDIRQRRLHHSGKARILACRSERIGLSSWRVCVVAAYTITNVVRHQWSIAVAVTILAAFVPHDLQHRYWLQTALIALLILLGYGLAPLNLTEMHGLFTERLGTFCLGPVWPAWSRPFREM